MAWNFPDSPTDGQQFTPAGGPTYVWSASGTVWKLVGGIGAPGNLSMSDTPPPSPSPGQMWWESDTGNLFAWFSDADSSQWVQINVPNVSGIATSQAKNRIVNGAFQVSQELGTASTTIGGSYIVDQWQALVSGIVFAAFKSASTAHQIQIQITTGKALAAGDYLGFSQPIEGLRLWDFNYGLSTAVASILRFDVYSSITGTFGVSIRNGASNRSLILPFTVSTANVWATYTFRIPGDTAGTWVVDNTASLSVSIIFACGTTYSTAVTGWQAGNFLAPTGITNGAATAGNTFFIRNVGLYLDDGSGIPPRWEMPDEASELLACMRYWENGNFGIDGYQIATGYISSRSFYKAKKRIIPTISAVNVSNSNVSASALLDSASIDGHRSVRQAIATSASTAWNENYVANARM